MASDISPMMEGIVSIAAGITGVAILAVLVSKNANTAAVLQAGASGFSNMLGTAISPVTGSVTAPVNTYPGGGGGIFSPHSINMN